MARQLRIEYAGAAYHVMARGNQGKAIYADERDRKMWLETVEEACERGVRKNGLADSRLAGPASGCGWGMNPA